MPARDGQPPSYADPSANASELSDEQAMPGKTDNRTETDMIEIASENSFPASDPPAWASGPDERAVERSQAVHQEYLTEVERMVDEETNKLFTHLAAVIRAARMPQNSSDVDVSWQGRSFSARNGDRTMSAHVEAISDLADESARAQAFPDYQARCRVRIDEQQSTEWVLHRSGSGDSVRYDWMPPNSNTPISDSDIATALQPFLAAP